MNFSDYLALRIDELQGEPIRPYERSHPGPPSEQDIQQVETDLQAELPDDYRTFLRYYSLYLFHDAIFPVQENMSGLTHAAVEMFFGVYEGDDNYDVVGSYRWLTNDSDVTWPTELLLIVVDAGHNRICIVINGRDKGHVKYVVGWDASDPDYIFHIAESFTDFIESLRNRNSM